MMMPVVRHGGRSATSPAAVQRSAGRRRHGRLRTLATGVARPCTYESRLDADVLPFGPGHGGLAGRGSASEPLLSPQRPDLPHLLRLGVEGRGDGRADPGAPARSSPPEQSLDARHEPIAEPADLAVEDQVWALSAATAAATSGKRCVRSRPLWLPNLFSDASVRPGGPRNSSPWPTPGAPERSLSSTCIVSTSTTINRQHVARLVQRGEDSIT